MRVQADGERLELYGEFQAWRQQPSLSKTEYAVFASDRCGWRPQKANPRQGPTAGACRWLGGFLIGKALVVVDVADFFRRVDVDPDGHGFA
jgi:hypothetical protein